MLTPALAAAVAAVSPAVPAPVAGARCLTYDSAYAAAPLMRVRAGAGPRVHLQDTAMPSVRAMKCAWVRAGYVMPGDDVLVSAPANGFRCAYVAGPGRILSGFLPNAALTPEPDEGRTLDASWLPGRWSDGSNLVVIARKGPGFIADGDGIWPGRDFAGPPGPNIGGFHGSVVATAAGIKVVDDTCEVTARRRGPFLLFADNQGCGGMNVRFIGLYAKGSRLK